ncbi:hypothetical protein [Nannocystis radixulma]|uniref:Uncharacterized protein n=1 Tax=Nannocystis radixulma TaxID=2995305 RepID=A0ABT5B6R3_9BACT|nr:hypothetical protein [Nannocystis radixulma]MDC0669808.1 hypothetical protein [Nannocystis radixulma]
MRQEQEDIQRLIARARGAQADEAALARVWQRLQSPPPPDGDGGVEVPSPEALAEATQALAGKAAIAAGLKTLAAAAVVGAALVGGRWLTDGESQPKTREVPVAAAPVVSVAAREEPASAATAEIEVVQEVAGETSVAAPATKTSGRRHAAGADDGSTLEQERKLVEAAQAALQRGEPAAALQRVEEHARRFARGLLADEREVLRVLALCAEQREAEAEAAAKALLATTGPGLFLPRLRGSCVGERLVPVQRPRGDG